MRSLRLRVPEPGADVVSFVDRFAGKVEQHLAVDAGDFVLKRADGFWAYQLAVVVDDAAQGVTDVVRGADLLDSTPRQIYLQRLLGLPTPRYLHVPVLRNAQGEKLSKQTGAAAVAPADEARRWPPCWPPRAASACRWRRPIRWPRSGRRRSRPGRNCWRARGSAH